MSEETIRRWIRSGELEADSLGRSYRINEDNLRKFLEKKGIKYEHTPLTKFANEMKRTSQGIVSRTVQNLEKSNSLKEKTTFSNENTVNNNLKETKINKTDIKELPKIPLTLNTSDNNVTKEFYEPCLQWAKNYDRAVGYFTSSWMRVNAKGMSVFASNGGKARWIISPIMEPEDIEAIMNSLRLKDGNEYFTNVLKQNVELLKEFLEHDTLNAIAWMVYDGIIEFRFAVPTNNLEGDFHDKFGIFSDDKGNKLSFNGSVNDSYKGTVNYESLKIFQTWKSLGDFVKDDEKRFERLWKNKDPNVAIYKLPKAIEKDIFELRTRKRPYTLTGKFVNPMDKWRHQSEAINTFLEVGNGILEMATGTGKTRTALEIIKTLFVRKKIRNVIITVNGTDLLDQWYRQIIKSTNLNVYRFYSSYKELSGFMLLPTNSVLLVSRNPQFLEETLQKMGNSVLKNSIIVCDEVHGFGSPAIVGKLKGRISGFKYRLGLSATPEREYDEEGNKFITDEIGEVIYKFDTEDAIKRGILCEFEYYPLEFMLTQEDKVKIKKIISTFKIKEEAGEVVDHIQMYTRLAEVKKVSPAKLPAFKDFLDNHLEILNRSIIFVETKEFGIEVQNILIDRFPHYHTYYGEDDRKNLSRFSKGEINCLITSKRISEGIDIQSVNNIILFSADRARLQTIQRTGRCLRINPNNPGKKANVVDFICVDSEQDQESNRISIDVERREWLLKLSQTRREE
ncbi:hypothetical protein CCE28_02670 [Anaeromicrobium sediminis]|uniref:Uncharacterized protein n=2 Tax=Anaeromicrobium sediminis TaxID=1478221 RepID=A0A267MRI4_9FIRM|nr:hypothetical protein CCE28_02670 [Anaeromicrobium sediminis]